MINLKNLTWQDFELLVEMLLGREGYRIVNRAKMGTRGPDFEAVSPTGIRTLVECKHFTRTEIGPSLLRQFVDDIDHYRQQSADARGILIFSGNVSAAGLHAIAAHPKLDAWFGSDVLARLALYPDIVKAFQHAIAAHDNLVQVARSLSTTPSVASPTYVTRLAAIPKGHAGWKDYELLGAEILTKIFTPALGPPEIQNRSEDGLDIMDAIFPIRAVAPPWSLVRSEYATRFVVAEFKNYTDPIGQKEVEAIAQYLWQKAQRQFGIVVTRLPPGPPALAQRRRKWIEDNKMIVILTDDDLLEMLQMRESERDPFDVIDAHLEAFLRTLSP
jgi:hypothetical protein